MGRPLNPDEYGSVNRDKIEQLFGDVMNTPISDLDADDVSSRIDEVFNPSPPPHTPRQSFGDAADNTAPRSRDHDPHSAIGDEADDDVPGVYIPSFTSSEAESLNSTDNGGSSDRGGLAEPARTGPPSGVSPAVFGLWNTGPDITPVPDPDNGPELTFSVPAEEIASDSSDNQTHVPKVEGTNSEISTPITPSDNTADNGVEPTDIASSNNHSGFVDKVREKAGSRWSWYLRQETKVKAFLALVVVMVVVVAGSLMFSGGDDTSPQAGDINAAPAPVETPTSIAPTTDNGILVPQQVTANCPSGSSRPELAFNGDKKDAWICVRAHGIDGTILTVTFKQPVVINEVTVIPGFNYVEASGIDRWTQHRLVSRILWRFGDTQVIQNINPVRTGASVKVDSIATQTVSLTILETVEPDSEASKDDADSPFGQKNRKDQDSFAIPSIEFTGHNA